LSIPSGVTRGGGGGVSPQRMATTLQRTTSARVLCVFGYQKTKVKVNHSIGFIASKKGLVERSEYFPRGFIFFLFYFNLVSHSLGGEAVVAPEDNGPFTVAYIYLSTHYLFSFYI
jgi:hypothetical protein